MSRNNKGTGPDTLLLLIGVLVGISMFGPVMALQLRLSLTAMAIILAPILGTVAVVVLGVLIFKLYWNRY